MSKAARAKRAKITWLCNKSTKEMHRMEDGAEHPHECHLDISNEENFTTFRTAREAREAGFDASAFCTKRFKSRENT